MLRYEIGQPDMLERRDCMVRALSNGLDKPYYEVHRQLKALGRRMRRGTPWSVCVKAMLAYNVGIASPLGRRITHARFIKTHPKGSFIVMSRSHAWAIKDGVVFDSWRPGPKKQILHIGVISKISR